MINVITDLMYGDCGKGKTAAWLANSADICIRVGGGPQAGHTFSTGMFVCQIPSGVLNPKAQLCIGRGTIINPEIVLKEINQYNVHNRIFIDPGCTIIEKEDIENEQELVKRIGSVGTGCGPARVRRILRSAKIARDIPELKPYLRDVSKFIIENKHLNIVLEGVQGYGLDLYNAKFYPFVTSQSTNASQFCADAGIGPRDVGNVYGVCKAYTTRVGAGYLYNEWEPELQQQIGERGTISGRLRRVGDFDVELVKEAIAANSVNKLIISCVDRLYPQMIGVKKRGNIPNNIFDMYYDLVRNKLNFNGEVWLGTGSHYNDFVLLVTENPNV